MNNDPTLDVFILEIREEYKARNNPDVWFRKIAWFAEYTKQEQTRIALLQEQGHIFRKEDTSESSVETITISSEAHAGITIILSGNFTLNVCYRRFKPGIRD